MQNQQQTPDSPYAAAQAYNPQPANTQYVQPQYAGTAPVQQPPAKTPFYKSCWFTILWMILIPPVGIALAIAFDQPRNKVARVIAVLLSSMLLSGYILASAGGSTKTNTTTDAEKTEITTSSNTANNEDTDKNAEKIEEETPPAEEKPVEQAEPAPEPKEAEPAPQAEPQPEAQTATPAIAVRTVDDFITAYNMTSLDHLDKVHSQGTSGKQGTTYGYTVSMNATSIWVLAEIEDNGLELGGMRDVFCNVVNAFDPTIGNEANVILDDALATLNTTDEDVVVERGKLTMIFSKPNNLEAGHIQVYYYFDR